MAKREWGAKRTCMGCGLKFYDLHRKPIACPKCGTEIEVETPRPNRRRPPARPEPSPPPASVGTGIKAAVDETDDASDEVIADVDSDDDDALVVGIDKAAPIQPEP